MDTENVVKKKKENVVKAHSGIEFSLKIRRNFHNE